MKKHIYIFFIGLICSVAAIGNPHRLVLDPKDSSTQFYQANNSFAGYSYTSNNGAMLAGIMSPSISGDIPYSPAINPNNYEINPNLAVGKTPGNLVVGGSAGYSIPIEVPAGTNGMQPSISLNYTSSFADGIMGIGWNIGGLSSISRINNTIYNDGKSDAVRGTLADKYALDGKRLVIDNGGGTYGYDSSVYRTELEEFSKIVAHGTTGQGPEYFVVYTKSGLIYEYGNTADSKLKIGTTCILSWKLNKITDRYNNFIRFSYVATDDERPIAMIEYTGNGTIQNPFAQIRFNYKTRADVTSYVYGGKEFIRDILLDSIEIKNNGQPFKKYGLDYMRDTYAQLQKVTEYSSQNIALNPTVFAWTNQTEQFTHTPNYSSTDDELYFVGDFNGDGREDLVTAPIRDVYSNLDRWKLYLADTNGTLNYWTDGALPPLFETFLVNDFNGDGLTDLMMQVKTTGIPNQKDYYFYQSTGTTFTPSTSYYRCYDNRTLDVVDYNGDGKLEFLYHNSINNWYLYTYLGVDIYSASIPSFGLKYYAEDDKMTNRLVDFNGDGCTDLLVLSDTGYKLYEFKGANNILIETASGTNMKSTDFLLFGDYNGDGAVDIIKEDLYTYNWSILSLINGGFQSKALSCFNAFSINTMNNRIYARDVNADGRTDVILVGRGTNTSNNYNRINVALSSGNDFSITEYVSTTTTMMPGDDSVERFYHFGDFNGDGRSQLFYKYYSTSQLFSFANGTPSHLVNTVIDGLGAKSSLSYLPMSNSGVTPFTNGEVYIRGSGASFPVCDISSSMQLVSHALYDNGIDETNSVTYKYFGAKLHREGKGFLGFSKQLTINDATGIITESNYTYDETYYYPKIQTVYTRRGNTALTTTTNNWASPIVLDATNKRIFPYISSVTEVDNLTKLSVGTTVEYHPDYNLKSVTKDFGGGHTQKTEYLYNDERTADWLIGRPTTITETSQKGTTTNTYVTTRSYSPTNNSPDIDYNNEGDLTYWRLDRDYDAFGNLWKEKRYSIGLTEQTTVYTYWANNVNVETITDPAGNKTTYDYYPATGLIHTKRDPFNNMIVYNYNSNDQLSSIVPSKGITTTITRNLNVTDGPAYSRYYVLEIGNDGSETKKWYDKLGRELRTETKKFGGQFVKVDKQYNTKGQLATVSEPSTGTPSTWNWMGYNDDSGKIIHIGPNFGPITTIGYTDSIATRTVNNRNYTETVNAAGLITKRTDPGGTIVYKYFPNGNLRSTIAPGGVTTSMTYDRNGNRLTITDPSAGTVTNTWYGTGQLKTQQNGRGQTTTYTYQSDGLLDYYTTSPSDEGLTDYSYTTKKQLSNITTPDGVSRSYTYCTDGRDSIISESIGGVSNEVRFSYDIKGRLYRKYFNGTDYEQYDYDTNNGYLYRIQFNGATVWELTTMDEYLRVRQANIGATSSSWGYDGNNLLSQINATGVQRYDYSFNADDGNLTYRTNFLKNKTDSFKYDNDKLDRLTSVIGPQNLSVGYTANKNGNILSKSDAGTYAYDNTPYAVSGITNGQNISTTEQDITYYSFEKVKKITEGTKTADFIYNADHQRIRMILKDNGTTTKTRWYFGGSCERELVGTTVTQYIWIGGDAYTAVAVAKKVGTGSWTVYNIFRDHLGTITHLKNGTNPADEYSFDAWGRRRDKDDWTYTLTSEPFLFADRGFTGHEYLEDFKLYNMNGRLYDPVVGRFLSPDPYVQSSDNSQNFNRYSYCLNNPLKYNDPDGEFFLGTILTFVGDLLKTAFIDGGLDPTSKSARQNAWKDFDPTAQWSPTNKAWKIDIGGFKTDPNRTIAGRGLQLLSRWTWELPQTILGKGYSHLRNMTGNVDDVSYYGGATLVNKNDNSGWRWGLTLGSYINSKNVVADPYTDDIFRHEYGHTLQSRLVGPLYLTSVALPSLVGQGLDDIGLNNHNYEWYETQANRMSYRYLQNHDPGALDALPWSNDDPEYPREYHPTWYWKVAHPTFPFAWWLFF